jgi:hypothetical protein
MWGDEDKHDLKGNGAAMSNYKTKESKNICVLYRLCTKR